MSVSINTISAFDATAEKKITFTYSGNQCVANRIVVYNSLTNAEVFNERITSFALSHTIPEDTLTNGTSYYAIITAYYNVNDVETSVVSAASNTFYCLAAPTWSFTGLINDQIVANSSLTLAMTYSQAQSEEIDEFIYVVYTAAHTVFVESESMYNSTDTFTVTGLDDNAIYYLRAYGTTVNGLYFDTRDTFANDLAIHINYESPNVYALAYLENIKDKGYVKISTNIASIEGATDSGNNVVYINSSEADLRSDIIKFAENVLMSSEFELLLKCRAMVMNEEILRLSGEDNILTLTWRKQIFGTTDKYYMELKYDCGYGYFIYTEPILKPNDTDYVTVKVGFKNSHFELEVST